MLSRDYIQANLLYLSFKGKASRPKATKSCQYIIDKYMLCNYYFNLKQRAIGYFWYHLLP